MRLVDIIEACQGAVRVDKDGVAGINTWSAIYTRIFGHAPDPSIEPEVHTIASVGDFSARIIADMHGGASFNPAILRKNGIRLAIHRASLGMAPDSQFAARYKGAMQAELLWAAYALLRRSLDPVAQLNVAMSNVQRCIDQGAKFVKVVFDWEGDNASLLPSFEQIMVAVEEYQQRTGDKHPIIYGAHDQLGTMTASQVAKFNSLGCLGWYARYLRTPVGLPSEIKIFGWQDACPDDKGCEDGMQPIPGNQGADYSRYLGKEEDLVAGWPFNS